MQPHIRASELKCALRAFGVVSLSLALKVDEDEFLFKIIFKTKLIVSLSDTIYFRAEKTRKKFQRANAMAIRVSCK